MKSRFSASTMKKWLLVSLNSKPVGNSPEVNLRRCPVCNDDKWRAFFDVHKAIGYCHRHECVFTFEKCLEEVHGPLTFMEAARKLLEFDGAASFDLEDGEDRVDALLEIVRAPEEVPEKRKVPVGFTPFRQGMKDPRLDYILSRNIPRDWIYGGLFGTCAEKGYENRVVFLVLDHLGKPSFWVGRSIDGAKPKYLYPPSEITGSKPSEVLFNAYLLPKHEGRIVLCEGCLTALAAADGDFRAVASFGLHISDAQQELLLAHRPKEVVLVQEPGVSDAKTRHRAIGLIKAGVPVSVVKMPEGDPESHRELYLKLLSERETL